MKRNHVKKAFAVAVGCLLLTVSGYAQDLEKGEVEGTGQVGIVMGTGTHASFGGSAGKAVSDNVFVLGEIGYVPMGGASFSGTTPGGGISLDAGGRLWTFMAGAQYQFGQRGYLVPYAGAGLGFVRASGNFSSSVGGSTTNIDFSNTDFYASFVGGARYYVKDNWGLKPEFTIFAGSDTFFRFAVGVFYQFGR